ncbi:MAG: metalloregulator ArsR/SmtB family transcription factor [Candidatus Methanomethylophilaceae archaeon]|nr:metalloregulator ArsR/SmtB family transcription factor [Candidatus Methanomethylophilaceae archaeon]
MIARNLMVSRKLLIADMGCGAGLSAISLARLGHHVHAVDFCPEMLSRAKENADKCGVSIDFIQGDITRPELEKGTYDMVVARNAVWNLIKPELALSNWKQLLRPGGSIVIIDGNYYLDLYDEDYRKRREFLDKKNGSDAGLHYRTNTDNVDFNIIRDISYDLPLSRVRRPAWDVSTLIGIGMTDINVKSLDREPYSILTDAGPMAIPSSFVVFAKNPDEDHSDEEMDKRFVPIFSDPEDSPVSDNPEFDHQVQVLKALADANRMKIVHLLMSGSMTVQQISSFSGLSHSLTSHNLRVLKDAGLVMVEQVGKNSLYGIVSKQRMSTLLDLVQQYMEPSGSEGAVGR